ncbi:hypothetical protein CSB20_13390 [bacterium DOLZORAL124_64_63]|nr:MAG: hypothetical protein CSB20_13390 [bacterium DOLZORAL124_64_63]
MKNRPLFLSLLLIILTSLIFGQALAQQTVERHKHDIDPTTTPLIMPTVEDFAPSQGGAAGFRGNLVEEAPVGVSGYFEFAENNKIFNITPRYRFNRNWAAKLRVPWIAERKVTAWDGDVSTSGIGDIAIEGEYTKTFATPDKLLRLQVSLKLPTGDDERTEEHNGNDLAIPLGTGSLDYMFRGQYTVSTPSMGLLISAMLRKNTEGQHKYVSEDLSGTVFTQTTKTTEGRQIFLAAFGRRHVGKKLWMNLGASIVMTGDGSGEFRSVDTNGGDYGYEYTKTTKGSMLDLYPGISYDLGAVTPYLGARIPLSTNFKADGMNEERDSVFVFQISYRPLKMVD